MMTGVCSIVLRFESRSIRRSREGKRILGSRMPGRGTHGGEAGQRRALELVLRRHDQDSEEEKGGRVLPGTAIVDFVDAGGGFDALPGSRPG